MSHEVSPTSAAKLPLTVVSEPIEEKYKFSIFYETLYMYIPREFFR